MRHRQLHAALAAFAEEAAWQLAADTAAGHEVPFEVVPSGAARRDTPLYCYRPLTAEFIAQRQSVIARLQSYLPALHALGSLGDLEPYLRTRVSRGVPRDPRQQTELALRAFLTRVFADSADFALDPDRLLRAYEELEVATGAHAAAEAEAVVVASVLGLELESDEVALGDGIVLARLERLDEAPPAGLPDDEVVAVVSGDGLAQPAARLRLERLVTALRLYDPAGPCLGPMAWGRIGRADWEPLPLGGSAAVGRPRERCAIAVEEEDELRAFCSLVTRRTPKAGELAWALRRFELGCARPRAAEALTDHLLALRALLEPEGPASARLAGRVAALCAEPEDRATTTERVAHVVALERRIVSGTGLPEAAALTRMAREVEDDLRAILRDVLCGHLDADVRSVADRLIAAREDRQPTLA